MKREQYHTRQRDLILNEIMKIKGDFAAKDLYARLIVADVNLGMATLYRTLGRLTEEGVLVKMAGHDGSVLYRHEENCKRNGHCFLKCEKCGGLEHMDCKLVAKLKKHLINKHDFDLEQSNITIYGVCKKCQR